MLTFAVAKGFLFTHLFYMYLRCLTQGRFINLRMIISNYLNLFLVVPSYAANQNFGALETPYMP